MLFCLVSVWYDKIELALILKGLIIMHQKDIRFIFFQIFAFLTFLFPVFTASIVGYPFHIFTLGYLLFMLSGLLLIVFGFMYERIHKALFSIPIAIVIFTHLMSFFLGTRHFNLPNTFYVFGMIMVVVLAFAIVSIIIDKKELTLVSIVTLGLMVFLIALANFFPALGIVYSWSSAVFSLALIFLLAGMLDEDEQMEGKGLDTEDNIAINIVLSIITFGIYFIVWLYRMEVRIRRMNDDDRSLAGVVLCLIFVPFYKIYWFYNREQMFVQSLRKKGQTKDDNSLVYLLLSIFGVSLIAAALMQNDFNRFEDPDKHLFRSEPEGPGSEKKRDLALLKEIKTLYEEGVLSEAEYNEKKRQILDRL